MTDCKTYNNSSPPPKKGTCTVKFQFKYLCYNQFCNRQKLRSPVQFDIYQTFKLYCGQSYTL